MLKELWRAYNFLIHNQYYFTLIMMLWLILANVFSITMVVGMIFEIEKKTKLQLFFIVFTVIQFFISLYIIFHLFSTGTLPRFVY